MKKQGAQIHNRNRRTHGEGHGELRTLEYIAWSQMKQQCYNPNATDYKYYGKRGIEVCIEWLHSYENFLADMGRKPKRSYSLDRIDTNGDYEPENCKWSTPLQQRHNQRRIHGNRRIM